MKVITYAIPLGAVSIDKLALLTKQGLRQDSEAGTTNNDTIGT